ncbi:MAG TPA: nucleotidyltransferase domain-containing protein [Acetobacteraceae bacterium]|nr:nucleotidyltransferase domain-containing protein [Acetobacteraceae bacterium]
MLSENDVARIALRIKERDRTLAIGIFGSYAVGSAGVGSDLDLFVIKDSAQRPGERRLAMRRLLFGVLHPLDIHVFTPDEFESTAYESLSFAWVIARQARLYHWTEEARRRVPSLFVQAVFASVSDRW